MNLADIAPSKYSQLHGMGPEQVKLAPLWNHMRDLNRREMYCVHW